MELFIKKTYTEAYVLYDIPADTIGTIDRIDSAFLNRYNIVNAQNDRYLVVPERHIQPFIMCYLPIYI